jgi:thiol-disulfide isomerase/thioredoxin
VNRQLVSIAAVAIVAAGAGYMAARLLTLKDEPVGQAAQPPVVEAKPVVDTLQLVGKRRPGFSLTDADGRKVSAEAYDGRVLLINFWATWCAPCVEEMPMLAQFQREHAARLTVAGIAIDEPGRAREFARELGVDYPLLFGLPEAMLVGRRYGNHSGMLPYSVLVDASGVVRWTRLGALDREQLESQLAALPEGGG